MIQLETSIPGAQLFEIRSVHAARLHDAIKKLNRRAVKLQLPEIGYSVVSRRVVLIDEGKDSERREWRCTVQIIGERPQLEGWQLVGVVEHTPAGNLLRGPSSSEEILTGYREAGPHCDHCRTQRRRNETIVIKHESGQVARVGKTCLRDYLGGKSVAELAFWADLDCAVSACGDEDGEGGYGGAAPAFWDLEEFLSWCAASARVSGYVTRTAAKDSETLTATADDAEGWLWSFYCQASWYEKARRNGTALELTSADVEEAKAAIAWTMADLDAAKGSETGLNNFQHNLSVVIALGYVDHKHAGFACAVLGYHRRGIARAEDLAAKKARELAREQERIRLGETRRHLGEIGEKLLLEVVIGRTHEFPGYMEGSIAYLVTMETIDDGQALTWKASRNPGLDAGARCWIRGTVKDHREFRGLPTTALTRVAVRCPICQELGAVTKTGRPRKGGAPFVDLGRCGHRSEVPRSAGGAQEGR